MITKMITKSITKMITKIMITKMITKNDHKKSPNPLHSLHVPHPAMPAANANASFTCWSCRLAPIGSPRHPLIGGGGRMIVCDGFFVINFVIMICDHLNFVIIFVIMICDHIL